MTCITFADARKLFRSAQNRHVMGMPTAVSASALGRPPPK